MSQQKKPLHLCKTLTELNSIVTEKSALITTTNPSLLLKTFEKLAKEARRANELKDEEHAYVMYMRAAEIYRMVQKSPAYAKDPKYYKSLMQTTLLEAVKECEYLSESLKSRYSLMKEVEELDAISKSKELADSVANDKQRQNENKSKTKDVLTPSSNGVIKQIKSDVDPKSTGVITPMQLKNLIDQKSTTIVVIDCRGHHDFGSSHLDHSNCISIPSELLEPGLTANKIGIKLKSSHPESFHAWNKRGDMGKVILYDWYSSFENQQTPIATLYTAMTKWDRDTTYQNLPVILQGGIRNLYYAYPQLINHPLNTSAGLTKIENVTTEEKPLRAISYPDLDDNKTKNKNTSDPRRNNSQNDIDMKNNFSSNGNNCIPPVPSSVAFDRSKKPKSSTNISNGDRDPGPPQMNGDPTEAKVAALNAALDDVIESSNEIKKQELELDAIHNKLSGQSELPNDLVLKLKEKEMLIDQLQKIISNKDENLRIVQADFDALVAKRVKPSLPPIRPTQVEATINSKLKEKQELENYVIQLRAQRKEKERLESQHPSKLPGIPGSESNSPRVSRPKVSKSESTTFPTINSDKSTVGQHSISGSPLLRPMSQDATPISHQKLKDEPTESHRSNSLLKRSHSHPNIAQSLAEETSSCQDITAPQLPGFNRSLKPSTVRVADTIVPSRARQFYAVNSTERHRTGLKNLGNTCYMNSIMQCINHLAGFVEYFVSDLWTAHYKKAKASTTGEIRTAGEISTELNAALREMNCGHRSIALGDLKYVVGKHHQSFRGYEQQDSHEFLTFLLQWLHEELNQVPNTKLKEQKNDGLSDFDAANDFWNDFCASNRSKISEFFYGLHKSSVRCQSCGKESVTFEEFSILSVPIPSTNRKVDIQQCIDLYTTEEIVPGWNCVYCKAIVNASKKIDLWRLPPYLIIHLKRFYNEGYSKKRLTEVDFPIDNLDLTVRAKGRPMSQDARVPRLSFMLQAVSNHYGSMDGGHYTAYCRKHSQWGKFDDNEVSPINSRDVVTPAAYILFYSNTSP